ncbi:hypothetical protein Vadar_016738 [Vaccinium darrowii]|uniref:Uncharacterized protein n=1 Tax=Vaccinium darrowii TaxID=229202 RepID=A0ACB7XZZ2_9ERIC|nr:hypothetical protein Vadar_016738 [Vaccinium darrowii]
MFFKERSLYLRSFLCLRLREKYQPRFGDDLPCFLLENFKLLRVMHFLSVPFNRDLDITLPRTTYSLSVPWYGKIDSAHLVHLRYLAIAYASSHYPTLLFSHLLNLETLNIRALVGSNDIELPHDIFKMAKLRHLYTKDGVFTFHHSSEELEGNDFERSSTLDSLQTFHQVCACEACRCVLIRTPNLRKLGLYAGRIPNDMVLRFPDIEFLKCLEKLTFTANLSDSSRGRTLPSGLKLPLTMTRITLKCTRLKWEELSLLQNLPKLEVLRLLLYACVGLVWNASELEGFPELKYLKFYALDIEEWNASEDQFPKLEVLVIERCYKLKQIPIAFGNLNELREIKLVDCTSSAEELAREIQEEHRNRNGDDDCLNLHAQHNL